MLPGKSPSSSTGTQVSPPSPLPCSPSLRLPAPRPSCYVHSANVCKVEREEGAGVRGSRGSVLGQSAAAVADA
eukprot:1049295-Rhodomonas_salina.1